MPVIRLNDTTMRVIVGDLVAEYSTASQYVTVFRDGQPAGSLSRRRVIDHKACEWSIFDRSGRKLGEHNMVSPLLHKLRNA